ncbi:hypothetical protein H6P81_017992 [Aristolochia fimbriata]|uniref:Uncharacterized protein n=1 Tax=Aristolochia fimbriata TaxID=158543 RepID=A0AAV7E0I6_ARIFI|nr:hypothetical protein H6P81_017992 [Aristolochia fimbriata]
MRRRGQDWRSFKEAAQEVGYIPDYLFLLQTILQTDSQEAVNFALVISPMEGGGLLTTTQSHISSLR